MERLITVRKTIIFLLGFFCSTSVLAGQVSSVRAVSESKYRKAHSLGDNYVFDPRDGWQSVNVTNMQYKYRRQSQLEAASEFSYLQGRSASKHTQGGSKKAGISQAISGVLKSVIEGLQGVGKPEPVTITWYTGHDLKNPSCWKDGKWSPTDESFACALTMDGWTSRPKCFKFLELCNTPKKCVFVRVVDTCAGCAPGSKHVDLTRAAFSQLASLDEGVLQVQLRTATEPRGWYEELWGPKVEHH